MTLGVERTSPELHFATADDGPGSDTTAINVLGGFSFIHLGTEMALPETAERLLAYLAVKDRPIRRAQLAATFWPDASEKQALANLRSTLWRLLGPPHDSLDVGTRSVGVWAHVPVDLRDAASLAYQLIDDRRLMSVDELTTASESLGEDLLPDWYDDWALHESERWRQLRLHALEALAQRLVRAGLYTHALDAALRCVEADPLRETAHAGVIKVHLAEHNRSEAIRAFDRCSAIMHAELGLGPSEQLRALLLPSARPAIPISRYAQPESDEPMRQPG